MILFSYLDMFKGSMRLAADPKEEGSVTAAEAPGSFTPNQALNVSMIEYEIVNVWTNLTTVCRWRLVGMRLSGHHCTKSRVWVQATRRAAGLEQ